MRDTRVAVPPEEELSATHLAELLERVPDIVWRYQLVPTPGFQYVSPSVFAITGYSPAEHYADPDLGRRIAHPDDLPLLEAAIASPDEHPVITMRWRHRTGVVVRTEQRITVVRDESGHIGALEGIARPVTPRERKFRIHAGDLVLDLATHRVLVEDRVVELTPAEHIILALLAGTDGPVSHQAIVARLWGRDQPGGARTVQVHVSNLRRKIEQDPRQPRRILTVRGVGYALADPRNHRRNLKIP